LGLEHLTLKKAAVFVTGWHKNLKDEVCCSLPHEFELVVVGS
jgi:hypothetical protein